MELKLQNGDYVPNGAGGLERVTGQEELLQRVLFRLIARRGAFPFQETLGSRLWQLGRTGTATRQSAAEQYVAEALEEETGLRVDAVTLTEKGGGVTELTAEMTYEGQALSVTLEIQ